MIQVFKIPQLNNNATITYGIEGDVLKVTINEIMEEFDFTGLPDGVAEGIEPEELPLNPLISAEKKDGIVSINLLWFYKEEEREVYEYGEDQMDPTN